MIQAAKEKTYNAYILAAAVANLTPSNPWEGKFPSHNYKVREKFDIAFEIAPRAIDEIKRYHPTSCLIGYKLFDSPGDEELIEAAKHTLEDSKANVVFANKPNDASTRKLAVMQDGSVIEMDFDQHMEFIKKAIDAEYFHTEVTESTEEYDICNAKALVTYFEQERFDTFGTIALKLPDGSIVTTARGHKGKPVQVYNVNKMTKTIQADGKATLNAHLLWEMLRNKKPWTYVIHRHTEDPRAEDVQGLPVHPYEFPGTLEETNSYRTIGKECNGFIMDKHGYMLFKQIEDVDWREYHDTFPEKYFSDPVEIDTWVKKIEADYLLGSKSLEVGGNTSELCNYKYEPNIQGLSNNLSLRELSEVEGFFKVILLRNSINYLSEEELDILKETLADGGTLIANGFIEAPNLKITDTEVAVKNRDKIKHFLMIGDKIVQHEFYSRGEYEYNELGFLTKKYSDKSMYIQFNK